MSVQVVKQAAGSLLSFIIGDTLRASACFLLNKPFYARQRSCLATSECPLVHEELIKLAGW
jgi:hypothetical protein